MPEIHEYKGINLIYPKDGRAGGTWIAASGNRVACLLNGAFKKHQHNPPYRLSRGILLLDSFHYHHTDDFVQQYHFEGIEPFTLIWFDTEKRRLFELRWDEKKMHLKKCPTEAAIWSSATLYTAETQLLRTALFKKFIESTDPLSGQAIFDFHLYGSIGDPANDFVMNKPNGVETLSVSQIECASNTCFKHFDLMQDTHQVLCI